MSTQTLIPSPSPHIASLQLLKVRAENVEAQAKIVADKFRAEFASQVLAEAFPGYDLAVFIREWSADAPSLYQLLSSSKDQLDIQDTPISQFTEQQRHALLAAETAIRNIDDDEALLQHLELSDELHDGYIEFDLRLGTSS